MRSHRHVSDLAELLRFPFDRPRRLCVTKNRVFTCTSWPTSPSETVGGFKHSPLLAKETLHVSGSQVAVWATDEREERNKTRKSEKKKERKKYANYFFRVGIQAARGSRGKLKEKKKVSFSECSNTLHSPLSSSSLGERLREIEMRKEKGTRGTLHAI